MTANATADADDANPAFIPFFWDKSLPIAHGKIAKQFAKTSRQLQVNQAEEMAVFINTQEDRSALNLDSNLVAFLIAIPNSRKVRLCYGTGNGFGLTGITTNHLQAHMLTLSGEHDTTTMTSPSILTFPPETLDLLSFKVPTNEEFETERTKLGAGDAVNNKKVWFKAANLTQQVELPKAVPIPAFLVYDGFAGDLDAIEVFERLTLELTDVAQCPTLVANLTAFLKAVVVSSKTTEPNIKQEDECFVTPPTHLTLKWKAKRFRQLFPELVTQAPTLAAAGQATQTAPSTIDIMAQFMNLLKATKEAGTNKPVNDEDKTNEAEKEEDNPAVKLNISDSAFTRLLTMCGVTRSCADELPEIWTQLAEKKATNSDKEATVRACLSSNIKWKEAKVYPLSSIVTMIIKRSFEGEHSMSTLASATKGLTPFAVPCMTNEAIDAYNTTILAVRQATSTTVADIKATKQKATCPSTMDGLILVIKRFGNLLSVLFTEDCPLFIVVEEIIHDMELYEITAKLNFPPSKYRYHALDHPPTE